MRQEARVQPVLGHVVMVQLGDCNRTRLVTLPKLRSWLKELASCGRLTVGGARHPAVRVHSVVATVRGRSALQRVVGLVRRGLHLPGAPQRRRQLLQVVGRLQPRDDAPVVALQRTQLVWNEEGGSGWLVAPQRQATDGTRGTWLNLTIQVLLEAAEGIGAGEGLQPHAEAGAAVVVHKPLDEHLLVGTARADLEPLQLEQLMEDAPLQVVPAHAHTLS